MTSQLAGDTYFATQTRTSNLLQSRPSLRERAQLLSSLLTCFCVYTISNRIHSARRSLRHWHRVWSQWLSTLSSRFTSTTSRFINTGQQIWRWFCLHAAVCSLHWPRCWGLFICTIQILWWVPDSCASSIKVYWYSDNFPHSPKWSFSTSPAFRMQSCHAWPTS